MSCLSEATNEKLFSRLLVDSPKVRLSEYTDAILPESYSKRPNWAFKLIIERLPRVITRYLMTERLHVLKLWLNIDLRIQFTSRCRFVDLCHGDDSAPWSIQRITKSSVKQSNCHRFVACTWSMWRNAACMHADASLFNMRNGHDHCPMTAW
jgi:hypothetical protein